LRVQLLFPPGWTLAAGGPHLALPLLKSFLAARGINASIRDLNWETGHRADVNLDYETARTMCANESLSEMNEPYFTAEDKLMRIARPFGGRWNAQVGFEYEDLPQDSSAKAIAAVDRSSPFTGLYGELIRDIANDPPDLIGLCLAAVQQIVPALQLCNRIRKSGYEGFVVLGGNTVSRLAREMATNEIFDIVDGLVTFQGEISLLRLCEAIESGKSLTSVPQLIWRNTEGIHWNRETESADPDGVPAPDFSDLPVGRYWGANYVTLLGARGCYYGKCSFCPIPYGWGHGGYAGVRAADRVYDDMLRVLECTGLNRFKFIDEALSPKFMRALASRILKDGVDVEWEGYTRLESAWQDPHFVDYVGSAGFRKGYFGLEVLPSPGRWALNKHDYARPDALLGACATGGVKVHLFCMFGYPRTGEEDAKRTTDFLLNNRARVDTADIFPWTYAKHTTVSDARPVVDPKKDWSLEFEHIGMHEEVLSAAAITEMASRYEEIVWTEVPRLLHPTYRLVSPWTASVSASKVDTASLISAVV
jgi:hypothetical protein